jgi:hypothetical protein
MVLHDVTLCDRYNLNVNFLIFSRNFTRSTMLKFWVKTLVNKMNFSSLIITNMELRFESCVFTLIWKWCAKDLQKRKGHLISISFGVKKFTEKNTQKKKTLMFECYNLLARMEWRAAIFWGWFPTRWVQDPMVTSLNLHTLIFWEIDFSNYVKNCKVWTKNTRNFRGSNPRLTIELNLGVP